MESVSSMLCGLARSLGAPQAAITDVPTRVPVRFSRHSISRSSVAPSSTSLHTKETVFALTYTVGSTALSNAAQRSSSRSSVAPSITSLGQRRQAFRRQMSLIARLVAYQGHSARTTSEQRAQFSRRTRSTATS